MWASMKVLPYFPSLSLLCFTFIPERFSFKLL